MTARAELDGRQRGINVWFPLDPATKNAVKRIPGARFIPAKSGGPNWRVPATLEAGEALRAVFGAELRLGPALTAWGRQQRKQRERLQRLSRAEDAALTRVPRKLLRNLRPYQKAGAAFVAAGNVLIADEPGLGKTRQVIAGIAEAGMLDGCHIVIAPLSALEAVWARELRRFQNWPVHVAPAGAAAREALVEKFYNDAYLTGFGGWLIVNPAMVTSYSVFNTKKCKQHSGKEAVALLRKCEGCDEKRLPKYPLLHKIFWNSKTIDEVQENTVRNPSTPTSKEINRLPEAEGCKRTALSGTPLRGKVINFWGTFHWLDPKEFNSKWQWAERWCHIDAGRYGKTIGDLKEELVEAFDQHLAVWMIRRTKAEVAPELPPINVIDVWLTMEGRQAKQYAAMQQDAEVKLKDVTIAPVNVISEYTRLKQFSNAYCEWDAERKRVIPTADSVKLEKLWELLAERGIFSGEGSEKVIVFSQFSEFVDLIARELERRKVRALKITGATPRNKRTQHQDEFQQEGKGARVIVMNTEAGGVSITLDCADTVIIMDETWVPDDQEQAIMRAHRISRAHIVNVYYLRTIDSADGETIDEIIAGTTGEKQAVNFRSLDQHRLARRDKRRA